MRTSAVAIVVLLVTTIAVFFPVLDHGFFGIDDDEMVALNPQLNPPSLQSIAPYWVSPARSLYMPLTYTTWAGMAAVAPRAESDPAGRSLPPRAFHLLSLSLHLLAVCAVFALLRRLVNAVWPAALGAMFFALHPVQVESVAWIALTKDLLAGLLAAVALWQYVCYARADLRARGRRLHYAIALTAFALAMFAKPSAVVVPVAAAVIDIGLLRRQRRAVAIAIAPFAVIMLPFVILAPSVQGGEFAPVLGAPRNIPLRLRGLIASDALTFYLRKLLVPIRLGLDYGRSPWQVMGEPRVWVMAFVPILLAIVLWRYRQRLSGLAVGAALLGICVLPVLGLISFDWQEKSTVTDHYLYLAMIGPALAVAWTLSHWRNGVLTSVFITLLIGCAIQSRLQLRHWSDSLAVYRHGVWVNPQSWWLHGAIGFEMEKAGRLDEALAEFRESVRIAPRYATSHAHLGAVLLSKGEIRPAVDHLETSLACRPEQPEVHVLLGDIQAARQDYAAAATHYAATLQMRPDLPGVQEKLNRVKTLAP